MPELGNISVLRENCMHKRLFFVGVKGEGDGETGGRDELLEERRRQRDAVREKRRKKTKVFYFLLVI
jgi:hypothetical protein